MGGFQLLNRKVLVTKNRRYCYLPFQRIIFVILLTDQTKNYHHKSAYDKCHRYVNIMVVSENIYIFRFARTIDNIYSVPLLMLHFVSFVSVGGSGF